ncbi:MAG: glycosyltransferase family 39 protein [Tepidisphaeraceae bacterium]|jgi:uncharacterized membrane protein
MPTTKVRQLLLLLVILAGAAFLRFHKIARESDTLDELWTLSVAAGRDIDLPSDEILQPPPKLLFEDAPPSWQIWTHMDHVAWPPLYFVLLRWWIDLFGSGDYAIRTLSLVFTLVGIVLLFDVVRRISGPNAGLLAAAALALAWSSIDLSQDARNYTINFVCMLLAVQAVVRIEQGGISRGKLVQLGLATVAALLSHYFCLFTLIAIGLYALTVLRGRRRSSVVAALLAGAAFSAWVWGKWFLVQFRQRDAFTAPGGQPWAVDHGGLAHHLWLAIRVPAIHLFGASDLRTRAGTIDPMTILTVAFAALIILAIPIFSIRRKPILLIFWFQVVAIFAGVTAMDVARQTSMMEWQRYTSMAAPAMCALAVASLPLPTRMPSFLKWSVPAAVLLSLTISAAAQYQIGPRSKEDFRYFAGKLDRMAGNNDLLVFYPPARIPPLYWLLALDHYHPNSRPILILGGPITPTILAELKPYTDHLCLIGQNAPADGPSILPGWKPTQTFINVVSAGVPSIGGSIAKMQRTAN